MTPKSPVVRSLAAAAIAVLIATGFTACSSANTLKVCTSIPFEPFQYKDSWQDNEVVGFDVDIMDLVAEKLGKKQEIVDIGFGPITSGQALDNGDCDVAAAALSITPERQEVMDFSDAYYDADQALAVMPETKINSLNDMKGKLLGIQIDTTGADYAKEQQKEFGYEIKTFADLGKLREAVEYETVDGAIGDVPLWNAKDARHPGLVSIVDRYDTGEQYGYAVAKGDTDMLDTINEVLDDAKKDGSFSTIYEKWIGENYPGN